MRYSILLLTLLIAKSVTAEPSMCAPVTKEETGYHNNPIVLFSFGINDNIDGTAEAPYAIPFYWSNSVNSYIYMNVESTFMETSVLDEIWGLYINQIPVSGGLNFTTDPINFTRTADLTCASDNQTFWWGPTYPSLRDNGDSYDENGRFDHLEVHHEWSAPVASSHIRYIFWVKNKSNKEERFLVNIPIEYNQFPTDVSPIGQNRYLAGYPIFNPNPSGVFFMGSVHARGPTARDQEFVTYSDTKGRYFGVSHAGSGIQAGETKAVMVVYQFAGNMTRMLDMAAWVDSEPAELFYNLTANQLSQIVNWGACQAVLGPDVAVTIDPPTKCSSEAKSDFKVTVSTTRAVSPDDFNSPFVHRVINAYKVELVPRQESSTLAVKNDMDQVTHQLWYNGCLVKETVFESCVKVTISPPVAPQATSGASFTSVGFATLTLLTTVAML